MINYFIQILLFQVIFLTVYDLFLQRETFFKWNRFYLLITPILSFIIPKLKFELIQNNVQKEYIEELPAVILNPSAYIEQASDNNLNYNSLQIIFIVGVLIFIILFLFRLLKLFKLIHSTPIIKYKDYKLVVMEEKQSAFSFFNYIFINKHLLEKQHLQIIKHELVHCKHYHTIDLLVFEIFKIIMWFNPLIYVYQNRITLLHEYISDAEVVKETDKLTYFDKLLLETFSTENISFINQFFKNSFIKKRIVMITKNKSKKINQLKYLFVVPVLVGMLLFSSFQNYTIESLNDVPHLINDIVFKPKEIILDKFEVINSGSSLIDTIATEIEIPFAKVDKTPVYPKCKGSQEELRTCFQEQISFFVNKNFNSDLAKDLNLQPGLKRIFVMFKIDKSGEITDIQARAPHIKLEEEAIRVIRNLPKMKPGKHGGNVVSVKYSLPISIMVGEKKNENILEPIKEINKEEAVPIAKVDEIPNFPDCTGSDEELKFCFLNSITAHISANFNSKLANELGLQAGTKRIFVIFTINKEGFITNVQARAPHIKLEEEAIRVISSLPKMKPGKLNGEAVDVKSAIPIEVKVD
ncbi:MAG: energy transducer TonB [Flavobacteriaceae bacterium]|nr:energy transducer TonB [Flavobacteriaceae bacterium]